jgi:hypothetical protein
MAGITTDSKGLRKIKAAWWWQADSTALTYFQRRRPSIQTTGLAERREKSLREVGNSRLLDELERAFSRPRAPLCLFMWEKFGASSQSNRSLFR